MTTTSKMIWRQADRESPAEEARRAIYQGEAALQALYDIWDTQLDPLAHCSNMPPMIGRTLKAVCSALLAAQTLLEAFDYFQARCFEAGISPEDAAVAWDIHSSEAFELELVAAEAVGPNALRMIDEILARLGIAPHDGSAASGGI